MVLFLLHGYLRFGDKFGEAFLRRLWSGRDLGLGLCRLFRRLCRRNAHRLGFGREHLLPKHGSHEENRAYDKKPAQYRCYDADRGALTALLL